MSNHEYKLLRYLSGYNVTINSLSKTITQCGELLLKPSFKTWLESLPYIIRWSDNSFVVHAGIIPSYSIYKQKKFTCIYIRTYNPLTKKISNEEDDPWFKFKPVEDITIYFGHNIHDIPHVNDWTIALDGGVVFGGVLRCCIDGKEIVEVKSRSKYY